LALLVLAQALKTQVAMSERNEIPTLTGLRGLAAATVLLYHYDVPGFSRGFLAVDVFFVLSGFVLAHVYNENIQWRSFFWARAARTLPIHITTTAVVYLISILLGGAISLMDFLEGIIGWRLLNTPAWSLTVEWAAYLLFPIALPLAKRIGSSMVLLIGIIGVAIGLMLDCDLNWLWFNPLGLGAFTIGVGMYLAGWRPMRSKVLDNKLVRYLGDISYPLYLLNVTPLIALAGLHMKRSPTTAIVSVTFVIFSAILLHHTVEEPSRHWLKGRNPLKGMSLLILGFSRRKNSAKSTPSTSAIRSGMSTVGLASPRSISLA
jgi:peptidoglycan/LPS O-acetylase OafA/YrhL